MALTRGDASKAEGEGSVRWSPRWSEGARTEWGQAGRGPSLWSKEPDRASQPCSRVERSDLGLLVLVTSRECSPCTAAWLVGLTAVP